MKRRPSPLATSLCLNAVLLLTMIGLMWRGSHTQPQPFTGTEPQPHTVAAPAVPISTLQPSFHWSQLDAPDFATYVRNLRGIGCPEATIHDILKGELAEIYSVKRQTLERQLETTPEASQAEFQKQLESLRGEQSSLLATLTGSAEKPQATLDVSVSAPASTGANAPRPASTGSQATPTSTLVPAAFMAGNAPTDTAATTELSLTPTDSNLTPATAEVITQMREGFASSLKAANAQPDSPDYQQKWLSAQRASDEHFSSMFGGDAFVRMQIQAAQQQAAAQQP